MKEMSSLKKWTNSNLWQTSQDEQGKGLTISGMKWFWDELRQVKKISVSLRQKNAIAGIDILNKKRKCCNHRCPESVYFNTLLLIIYLSAIETLVCCREMNLIGSASFGSAQNTIHDFQNTILNS